MRRSGAIVRSTRDLSARLLVVMLLALGALAFASPTPAGAATVEVSITEAGFDPPTLEIAVGDSVAWTNDGGNSHDVSADDGSFQSGSIPPGEGFTQPFDTEGTYIYRSTTDANLTGTIVVGGAAIGTAQSASPFVPSDAVPTAPDQATETPDQFAYTGAAESIALAVLGTVALLFGWAVVTGFGSPIGPAEPWRILALANPRRTGFTDELMPRGRWRRSPRRSTQATLLPANAHRARAAAHPSGRAAARRGARRTRR